MKTVVFNKNSWHYKLATEHGDFYPSSTHNDRCHYIRCVLVGLIKVLFLVGLAALGGSTFGAFLYTGYDIITTGVAVKDYPLFQQISFIVWSSIFLTAIAFVVIAVILTAVDYSWNKFKTSWLYKVVSLPRIVINVNKDSWHFWLAKEFGNLFGYGDITLFAYIWALIKAVLMLCFVVFVVAICAGAVLSPYVWAIWMAIDGFTFFSPAAIVIASIILQSIGVGIFLLVYISKRIGEYTSNKPVKPKSDSFFSEAYKTFKEKYCARVEFK